METFTCSDIHTTTSIHASTPAAAAEAFCTDFDAPDRSIAIRVVVTGGSLGEETEDVIVVIHPPEPRCHAACDDRHRWESPHALVGGIKENPGVWGAGGASIRIKEVCVLSGTMKTTTTPSQGVESEFDHTVITYEENAVDVEALAEFHGPERVAELVREGVLHPDSDLAHIATRPESLPVQ